MARSSVKEAQSPPPDSDEKPDDPTDLPRRSWKYVLRKVMREFGADACTDLAASLTYYFVLSLFPALVAIVSVLGLFGQSRHVVSLVLDVARGFLSPQVISAIRGPLESLATSPGAGIGFVVGILGAIWSASGYVRAFGRAMNRIYSVDEGRPFYTLRPVTLLVTVIGIVLLVVAALLLVLSGSVARSIGDAVGLGDGVLFVWSIVKWPVLAFIVVLLIAILYYATPNLKQPKFRWMSLGALIALIVWVVASVLFAFYVSNFSSYNKTYGSLGAVIVVLLWIWITNIALLFGAEFDAETERGRELVAGIAAEDEIELPPRSTKASDKKAAKHQEDVAVGRRLRETHGRDDDVDSEEPHDADADADAAEADAAGGRRGPLARLLHHRR